MTSTSFREVPQRAMSICSPSALFCAMEEEEEEDAVACVCVPIAEAEAEAEETDALPVPPPPPRPNVVPTYQQESVASP